MAADVLVTGITRSSATMVLMMLDKWIRARSIQASLFPRLTKFDIFQNRLHKFEENFAKILLHNSLFHFYWTDQ